MRKGALYLVCLAAIAGAVLSWISLQHYMAVNGADIAPPSFCNINETFNCDVVAASSYASFQGYSVAGFGLIFFVVQLVLGLWGLMSRESRGIPTVGLWTTLAAIGASAYFGYIMTKVLETLCLTCLGMDGAILLLFTGWLATGRTTMRWSELRGQWLSPVVTSAVVFAVGVLFLVNVNAATGGDKKPTPAQLQDAYAAFKRQAPVSIDTSAAHHPRWGNPNAPLTFVEFSDFECPYCARAAFKLKPYLTEFKDKVQLIFLNYPLDRSCNAGMQRELHRNACNAARASLCANQQGKFWPYHDAIFHDYRNITPDSLTKQAQEHKLDMAKFNACVSAPATDAAVQKDIALGRAAGISGTPVVFLNGRKFGGWQNREFLHYVIKKELGE